MFCKNCGTQLQDGAAFCPNCGAPVASEGTQNAETQQAQPQPQPQPAPQNAARKSKLAAGLLGIFLGGLGVHNFYLGFTKRALIQLLVSLLTCGFGAVPMEIWGLSREYSISPVRKATLPTQTVFRSATDKR